MRVIEDREKVRQLAEKYHMHECFDTKDIEFAACVYEPGETIVSPADRMDRIMFAVQGSVRIYGIRMDGSFTPVSREKAPFILGDMEYSEEGKSAFFAEAAEETVFLCVSLIRYKAVLDHDAGFLRMLLKSCTDKLRMINTFDAASMPLRERVLRYMLQNKEIVHLDPAVLQLRCSRRQLQRVLKRLCEEGRIQKTGKGHYVLL